MNTLQQELPKRFTDAVSKLYNAFHENKLDQYYCTACAVGNICDGNDSWAHLIGVGAVFTHGKKSSFFENLVHNEHTLKTGYSLFELSTIESVFMTAAFTNRKEHQFKGLCAVIEYLCELDNIQNIMDFTSLFETENDKPVKELQFV